MHRVCPIPGGVLRIETDSERLPLEALLGFAARANPKRPFLFVSRVMGRHIPCAPVQLRTACQLLAQELQAMPGPMWIVGMAETAIGLGGVLADTLARSTSRADICYQHTTRVQLAGAPSLCFEESHSHAPGHRLYPPTEALLPSFRNTRTLILVDDEITTGATLSALAQRLVPLMPALRHLCLVSLVHWLDADARAAIARRIAAAAARPVGIDWHHLLAGRFAFQPDADFTPVPLPARVEANGTGVYSGRDDLGRRGLAVPPAGLRLAAPHRASLPPGDALAVIGTGECALPAFLLAEEAAQTRARVTLQSTTRSPILVGGVIENARACEDPGGTGVAYALYNDPPRRTRRVLVSEHGRGMPLYAAADLARLAPARFTPAQARAEAA
jgi:hypothetical protein